MRQSICILEDNSDRIAVMDECLADKFPFFQRQFFRTAPAAVAWSADHLSQAVCISLDHDLEPTDDTDPGTGRVVADFLASYRPSCPVIIHSTNRIAADGMEMALSDGGWAIERIMPYENCRWIAEAWLPMIRQAIVNAAASESYSAAARAGS